MKDHEEQTPCLFYSHCVLLSSGVFSVPTNGCNNGMFPEGLSPELSLQMYHSVRYRIYINLNMYIKEYITNGYYPVDFILTAVTLTLRPPV